MMIDTIVNNPAIITKMNNEYQDIKREYTEVFNTLNNTISTGEVKVIKKGSDIIINSIEPKIVNKVEKVLANTKHNRLIKQEATSELVVKFKK